ncbi:glycine cleavage system aminomethyltransferase GcvT [Hyphomonas sp. WL0036]|uniref:glycine cleavage system aminomethyltransferase GcvT n=1 Tax=Hyphomonas sediminis TaxID=2866160 RepID=UPI001C809DBB|nr:glycine cleavage system aminomethyltransferase GcvT [Hyphomonas sediminis]MBY9066849.1 glycine cleavage system aminomethyltransferase GcvT [Hyphomonas sediminis]
MAEVSTENLKRTPLYDLHVKMGGKLVPFAGYEMPVQFEGVIAEHLWTRSEAGLFDVSHMGPCFLTLEAGIGGGEDAHAQISALIETLVPSDITSLKPGQGRLTVLLNENGGILDDLIITRPLGDEAQGTLYIVVNGAMKEQDWAIFEKALAGKAVLTRADDRILFALQGPKAEDVMKDFFPGCEELKFMHHMPFEMNGQRCIVSRCGYTGEDGFEVLIPTEAGLPLIEEMYTDERVNPIGLGARDSLRLESGLCLYGHDLAPEISPIEADLAWVIQKRRREAGNFPGAERILKEIKDGPARKRVGIRPLERAPAREGTEIQINGETVGTITSGGFGPSVDGPVAMGYIAAAHTAPGTKIDLIVRGKARPAEVAALPFVPQNYKR